MVKRLTPQWASELARARSLIDIALTGALLSGGAEPIHKIMTVITGYLDKWRPNP